MRASGLKSGAVIGTAVAMVWVLVLGPPASADSGSWSRLTAVPSGSRGVEGMSVAPVGDRIVAAYGYDGGDTRLTRIYLIDSNGWRKGAMAPGPARSEGAAVVHDRLVYAIGGRAGGVIAEMDRYSVAADRWTSLRDMPTPRAGLAAAVVGDDIYAIGGRRSPGGPCSQGPGGQLATVERYHIPTGRWTTVAPLPVARSDLGAATVDGKIYVFGGCRVAPGEPIHFLGSVGVYDPATDKWSGAPADLPTPRAAMYGVAAIGSRIFVEGGWNGGEEPLGANEIYSVRHDNYEIGARMLTPRAEMGVVPHAGRVYTVGGALPAFGLSSHANQVFEP